MKEWVKILNSERYGQIVIRKDVDDEDNEAITAMIKYEDLGYLETKIGYKTKEARDEVYEQIDDEKAHSLIQNCFFGIIEVWEASKDQ